MRILFKKWGRYYSQFAKERFKRFARGGGNWQPLAESTIKGRTKAKKIRTATTTGKEDRRFKKRREGNVEILRDTGTMFNALTIGNPGNLSKLLRDGIRFGFGGAKHKSGETATINQIATFHDEGKGVPQRTILAPPDSKTMMKIQRATTMTVEKIGNMHGRRIKIRMR